MKCFMSKWNIQTQYTDTIYRHNIQTQNTDTIYRHNPTYTISGYTVLLKTMI
jgi:hypothetical protein